MNFASLFLCCSLLCASNAVAFAQSGKVDRQINCFILSGKKACDLSIKFSGEIVASSLNEIEAALDGASPQTNWSFKQLTIDSPGGNIDASMAIGRLLRTNRISILIPKGGRCVSACVMIFAGAVSRLYANGKIGIHRPYLNQSMNSEVPAPDKLRVGYEEMLRTMRTYLREMNVSERLADDMLKVAPADMRYLTHDDLDSYGLTYRDPVEQETVDLQEAHSLGLDRREYVRRQAMQKAKCASLTDFNEFLACDERVMKLGR
jgi:hypothetical protein